jgi:hypothetical protein
VRRPARISLPLRVSGRPQRKSAHHGWRGDTGELLVTRDVPAFVQARFTSRTGELLRFNWRRGKTAILTVCGGQAGGRSA